MPARSIGSATISFGLVSIPVRLYSASESQASIGFNMLHAACRSRLKQQYICSKDGEVVAKDQTVKGYEFAKDQYVIFSEEEIKAMNKESSKAIEISEFVPAAKVDPIFFDGATYLGPDKGGERAYQLLLAAMRERGRSALARWAARGKRYLVLVRAVEGGLVMQQLHYADEVRPLSEVPIDAAEVKGPELQLALQLIDQVSSDEFHPEKYEDDVKKSIREAIQKKVEGHEVVAAPDEPKAQIIDLMEALKASLASKAPAAGPKPEPVTAVAEDGKKTKRAAGGARRAAGGG